MFWEIPKKMVPQNKSDLQEGSEGNQSGGKLGAAIGKKAFGVKSLTIGGYDSPMYKIIASRQSPSGIDVPH